MRPEQGDISFVCEENEVKRDSDKESEIKRVLPAVRKKE
jgi:hypothetical protein